ncbi:unnamed protein product [Linum trigynum]|uniref:Uncharacterized protein n=1 Tax=Linum trigynum TaxID=586398 RepID=A0AAV2FGB1_9ROSI
MGCCLSSATKSSPIVSASHPSLKKRQPLRLRAAQVSQANRENQSSATGLQRGNRQGSPLLRNPQSQASPQAAVAATATLLCHSTSPIAAESSESAARGANRCLGEEGNSTFGGGETSGRRGDLGARCVGGCSVSVSFSMSESTMSTATTANDEEVTMKQMKLSMRSSRAGKMSAAARMNRAFSTADADSKI